MAQVTDGFPVEHRRFLTREQAAGFLGVSVRTFDDEVRAGMWPPATRRGAKGSALTWDRVLLDRAADRLAGLAAATSWGPDMQSAERAALEATARGPATSNRHKHRHPQSV